MHHAQAFVSGYVQTIYI